MTDMRPSNCRFRRRDEGKPFPISACAVCAYSPENGHRAECYQKFVEEAAIKKVDEGMASAGYTYQAERDRLFTDEGQRMFLAVRDRANKLLGEAGAFTAEACFRSISGDTFDMLASVDRMVELEELTELTNPQKVWGQDRVFVRRMK